MKKKILIGFGIGDTFCSEASPRCIRKGKTGASIAAKASEIVAEDTEGFDGYVNVLEPQDYNNRVNPFGDATPSTSVIQMKLCNGDVFNEANQLEITDIADGSLVILDGSQLEHVLPADQFELYIMGVSICGVLDTFIKDVAKRGYTVTVYNDGIRPFDKNTIGNIIGLAKDRDLDVTFRKS